MKDRLVEGMPPSPEAFLLTEDSKDGDLRGTSSYEGFFWPMRIDKSANVVSFFPHHVDQQCKIVNEPFQLMIKSSDECSQ